ncbi:serine hydrolase domain-containing protein [Roseisolibacter agri]|uniref:Serine hydrolase n=1 Tax=Roseisolibacter agri TaxID=2014610 RepID=A0AA37V6F5_9BACT|nr:serine hydrolase domain-containing protein [Roseisolibacter agri]GLC25256.1 serine hydrolase [Roseisolibacter agri]
MSILRRFPVVAAPVLMVCVACNTQARELAAPETGPTLAPAPTAAADSAFVSALRAKLANDVQAGTFSGAVLVTRDGKTLFEGAYGLADRERNVPNTPQTQFRAGSMYKMMTAVATLQLVQAGTLRLDATVGTYLPDYPNADVKSKVTLHHLLTHTGGTGDIFGPEFAANRLQLRNVSDYIRLYGTRGPLFTPGAQHVYSNYGFILLGAIIERVTGKSYDDHVGALVLGPAGMTSTGTAPEDSLVPGRAIGYMRQGSPIGPLVSNASTLPYRGSPAGGGYSTVGDFARFAVAVRDRKLLDSTHTSMLYTGKVPVNQTGTIQYAYGFMDRIIGGRRWVGHGGSAAGMNGELVFEPGGGYVVVALSNFDPPSAGQVLNFIVSNLPAAGAP